MPQNRGASRKTQSKSRAGDRASHHHLNHRTGRPKISVARFRLLGVAFAVFFAVLIVRAFVLHLFPEEQASLETLAKRQYRRKIKLAPYRGTIYDRRGLPLAISVRTPSYAINPRVFDPSKAELRRLAKYLGLQRRSIRKAMNKKGYFAWLARKVSHQAGRRIDDMSLKGLHKIMEPSRFYPGGSAASHLLGAVGIDDKGLFGLEAKYDKKLRGEENATIQDRDARGQLIFSDSSNARPETAGKNLYLTIDLAIQEIAESVLFDAVETAKAKGGFAIVSDPYTGKILALANSPGFDPNRIREIKLSKTRNRAVADLFEPGSVVKPFVIGYAVDKGATQFSTEHDCEKNGVYKVGRRSRIRDDHPKERLTTEEVLIHSSNICTFKIAEKIGASGLYDAYRSFGFASGLKAVGLPGEAIGRLSDWKKWRPIRFATVSFGQGHLVTGMEIVRAYGAIANGGSLVAPQIVQRIESTGVDRTRNGISDQGTEPLGIASRVFSPRVSRELRRVLERVVKEGTGRPAATLDYSVGGKTGTAEKALTDGRGYDKDKRIASFAGFGPVQDPHIVVYVAIDEPGLKPYYGSKWAAPAFSKIVQRTLKYLNVAPDKGGKPVSAKNSTKYSAKDSAKYSAKDSAKDSAKTVEPL